MKTTLAFSVLALLVGQPFIQAAILDLRIVDELGMEIPCRVLVRSASESFVPSDSTTLAIFPDTWFMSDGSSRIELPDGEYTMRVERGLEFVRVLESLRVAGERSEHLVSLKRWVNMKERGYRCAENHIHIDSVNLASMLAAEGLDFGSSLTWWRGPDALRPIPPGDGPTRLLEFGHRRIPTSIFDAELEYDWGAAYIQNMSSSMPLGAEPGRPNLDYLRVAVNSGGTVHYQGGWSREVLLDALLGCVQVVNICNNNFALHRFQPRSRYSNLLEVEGFPAYPDTDVGMMQMNTDTYYRLLNCGLRLATGAGTACGVKKAPVGYNRSYVRVAENAALDEFNAAWRAGHNFVTNGPILLLETGQGNRPGDSIQFPTEGGRVNVRAEVLGDQPLSSLQIVVNGIEVLSKDLQGKKIAIVEHSIRVTESCWIAARCTARDDLLSEAQLAQYESDGSPNTRLAKPSRLRFAHTSPIYVSVGGHPIAVRRSVEEGLKMLDALAKFATRTADKQYLPSFLSEIERARAPLAATIR